MDRIMEVIGDDVRKCSMQLMDVLTEEKRLGKDTT